MAIYSDSGYITGADFPLIRPTLDLNFAATKTLDRRITFTRDSIGTYADELGIVRYASNNVPRFDHDPDTRESLGLLIEESRTNLITYSDITSGEGIGTGYANGGTTVSKGSNATAPDGTVSAWNTVYNGTSGDGALYKAGGEITTTNSTAYTLSVFAKVPSTNTYITGIRLRTFNSNHSANFNLLTGTVLGTTEGTTTNQIEAYPNGWYRCSIKFVSGTDGNQGVQFYLINNTSTALNSSGANGEELYLWGAQLEEGSFVTSYIPTSGSTVTRGSDQAKITGTNLTDFYNQPEGTIFADYKVIQSEPEIMYLSDNTSSKRIGLYEAGSTQTRFLIGNNGTQADTTSATTTVGDNIKAAGAYKLNDIVAAKNGVISSTDSSATIPDGIDRAYIGGYFNGTVEGVLGLRRLSYYPKRLPNAQLQGLTQQ